MATFVCMHGAGGRGAYWDLVGDQLGIEPDTVPGGHCSFLSQPGPLADAIERCSIDHLA